jgi:RecA/RadA recombinase
MMSSIPFRLRDLRSPASTQRLSLGCPHLDALVGGGIPVGCLTEVVGELKKKKREGSEREIERRRKRAIER